MNTKNANESIPIESIKKIPDKLPLSINDSSIVATSFSKPSSSVLKKEGVPDDINSIQNGRGHSPSVHIQEPVGIVGNGSFAENRDKNSGKSNKMKNKSNGSRIPSDFSENINDNSDTDDDKFGNTTRNNNNNRNGAFPTISQVSNSSSASSPRSRDDKSFLNSSFQLDEDEVDQKMELGSTDKDEALENENAVGPLPVKSAVENYGRHKHPYRKNFSTGLAPKQQQLSKKTKGNNFVSANSMKLQFQPGSGGSHSPDSSPSPYTEEAVDNEIMGTPGAADDTINPSDSSSNITTSNSTTNMEEELAKKAHLTTKEKQNLFHKKISTFESLPSVEHYTFIGEDGVGARPSLSELHGGQTLVDEEEEESKKEPYLVGDLVSEKELGISEGPKFGWIKGVLVRCLLNIWGVMLFLRLSWVVGQAGIGLSTVIIVISTIVILITAMSMAAICTNGEIKGGGAYYMLSRSLGPEFGGAIGIIFSLANAVSMSMNTVGVAETIVELMRRYGGVATLHGISDINWIRIIGCAISILLLGVVMAGLDWETKAQVGFLVLLLLSFASYFIGTVLPSTPFKKSRGVLGYNKLIFRQNFKPEFSNQETFFSVFAIFFPSFTGFLAGCNISGDLKNAQTAIPKGTFWAIFITSSSYLLMVWTFGASVIRDASGRIPDLYVNGNTSSTFLPFLAIFRKGSALRSCAETNSCKFGLLYDYQAAELQAAVGPLITIGIFAACLSSAIASLEGAAKVFQALCKDRLFPIINFFSVGTKKHDEPVRAYFLMFIISVLCVLIANLNILAPIISNFFLMSFALINYSCFETYMSGSIGFRPGFLYYNHWLSLIGGLLCLVTMFLIKWWATLITFFFVFFFYAYVRYKKPDVNWGSSNQANVYKNALNWVMKLNDTEEHVKNFRPQILVLTGDPRSRPTLIDFVNYFTKNLSLMICGHVILENTPDYLNQPKSKEIYDFLYKRRVKSLYDTIRAPNLRQGAFGLLEVAGLGRLKPNIVIMGMMSNWRDEELVDVNNYFYIIHDAFDLRFGLGIFRMPEGLDFSFFTIPGLSVGMNLQNKLFRQTKRKQTLSTLGTEFKHVSAARKLFEKFGKTILNKETTDHQTKNDNATGKLEEGQIRGTEDFPSTKPAESASSNGNGAVVRRQSLVDKLNERMKSKTIGFQNVRRMSKKYSRNIMASINKFQYKQHKGFIDIWWLFDDGGLTILLPYILSNRRHWENCNIRFFGLCNAREDQEHVHSNFASLLAKFRIEYSDLIIIPDIQKAPYPASIQEFDDLIEKYRVPDVSNKNYIPGMVTDEEYITNHDKTHRHIRLHEMLMNYSQNSNLVVMTLPIPRKGTVSTAMYMAWLDIISKGMPPFLFLRGNQQSVITFYS